MKSKKLMVAAVLMLTATTALAQQHIQEAFDALRQSKAQQEVWSENSVEKDPATGKLEGLNDTYDFVIMQPGQKGKKLINNILKAFEQDEPAAYSVSRGGHNTLERYVLLAVGNGDTGGVPISQIEGSTHIYACFLDLNDSLRNHRYAYALEWVEKDDYIKGRIVKTYATTLKFRQQKPSRSGRKIILNGTTLAFDDADFNSLSSSLSTFSNSSETWLTQFNTYKNQFLNNPSGATGSSYATQIYKLCKNVGSLDDAEKNMVATQIQKLRKKTKDEFIQQLFDMSIERLKK
ncbi:MAG: hypothetical protein K2I86_06705 [Prevotella sp.]|nr:hypothetical protein [Prevotella sp.]